MDDSGINLGDFVVTFEVIDGEGRVAALLILISFNFCTRHALRKASIKIVNTDITKIGLM